jgi:hypothetical protein
MTNNKSQNTEPVYNRIGYRTRIGFSQSLSTGIIAIDGSIQYDYADEAEDCIEQLTNDMWTLEKKFIEMGYAVAKSIPPKEMKDKKVGVGTKEIKNTRIKNKVTK